MVVSALIINSTICIVSGVSTLISRNCNDCTSCRVVNHRTIVTIIQLNVLCGKDTKYCILQLGQGVLRTPDFDTALGGLFKVSQHLPFLFDGDFALYLVVRHGYSLVILFVFRAIEVAVLFRHAEGVVVNAAFVYVIAVRQQEFFQLVGTKLQVIRNGDFSIFITDKCVVLFSGVDISCVWQQSSVVFGLGRICQQRISHIPDVEVGAFQVHCLAGFRIGLDDLHHVLFLLVTDVPVITVVLLGVVWIISVSVLRDKLIKRFQYKRGIISCHFFHTVAAIWNIVDIEASVGSHGHVCYRVIGTGCVTNHTINAGTACIQPFLYETDIRMLLKAPGLQVHLPLGVL